MSYIRTVFRAARQALPYLLLTLGVLAGLDVLRRLILPIADPDTLYLTLGVFIAFLGGVRAGLLSAPLILAHAALIYALPGQPAPDTANLLQLGALVVAVPLTIVLAGGLRQRAQQQLRHLQTSEDQMRAVLHNTVDGIITFDAQGTMRSCNPAAALIFGVPAEEIVGRPVAAFLPHLYAAPGGEPVAAVEDRLGAQQEIEGRGQDGRPLVLELTLGMMRQDEQPVFIGVLRDITTRKQAEATLRDSERQFRAVFDSALDAMLIFDDRGHYVDVNPAARTLFGETREGLLARSMGDALVVGDEAQFRQTWVKFLTEGFLHGEFQIRRADGTPRVVEFNAQARFQPGRHLAVIRDITARKEGELALRESEERFSTVFHASPELIAISTVSAGRFVDVNDSFLAFVGYSREEVIQHTAAELAVWADADLRDGITRRLQNGQVMRGVEIQLRTKAGDLRDLLASFELVELSGEPCLLSLGLDITARKQAEAAQARFAAVLETTTDVVGMTDAEGRPLYLNRAGRQLLGFSEAEDLPPLTLPAFHAPALHGWLQRELLPTVLRNGSWSGETALVRRDGQEIPVSEVVLAHKNARGAVEFLSLVARDISERLQVEQALQQANAQLAGWVRELEQRNRESTWLNEMGDLLQTCHTLDETYAVLQQAVPRLFPQEAGTFALINNSRNLVETVVTWGDPPPGGPFFAREDCWALRRGREHLVTADGHGLVCGHMVSTGIPAGGYLCVPLVTQGETLGVLHLRFAAPPLDAGPALPDAKRQLVLMVAEHTALALANMRLQESLRSQAIRDPLTGLFNRRYMEESLEREIRRAERNGAPLGIIMLDLDHFKRFNDTFGHAAGDALLRELGAFLHKHIREADIASRYGGEEFTLVMPDASREAMRQRAEELRTAARQLTVRYHGQTLGGVTLSMGVSLFPEHGVLAEDLLAAADTALYCAKAEGRDQVVMALRHGGVHSALPLLNAESVKRET